MYAKFGVRIPDTTKKKFGLRKYIVILIIIFLFINRQNDKVVINLHIQVKVLRGVHSNPIHDVPVTISWFLSVELEFVNVYCDFYNLSHNFSITKI